MHFRRPTDPVFLPLLGHSSSCWLPRGEGMLAQAAVGPSTAHLRAQPQRDELMTSPRGERRLLFISMNTNPC